MTNDDLIARLENAAICEEYAPTQRTMREAAAALREARRSALEAAAMRCEQLRWHQPWQRGAEECAAAIRALAKGEG